MSTGRRLAKRSILGTRVSTLGLDGLYAPGMIQAMKTPEDGGVGGGIMPSRYSVRFDDGRRSREVLESDIVGSGFKSIHEVQLSPGQPVFVTHNQREMKGEVVRHDIDTQDVILQLNENETLLKKVDEVRLVESRKSARLVNSDTDFSKLNDVNISGSVSGGTGDSQAKRKSSSRGSGAIAVPQRSEYVQIAGSRKRRTSESFNDEEEVMTECSAAMLLMKLSCSPHGLAFNDRPPSANSSSGASSFRSATPSPPLSTSTTTDEGIVKDLEPRPGRIIYQCTYPGCGDRRASVRGIEAHVRKEHLLKDHPDRLLNEGEEEFYYTEIEDEAPPSPQQLLVQQKQMAVLMPHHHHQQQQLVLDPARPRSYSTSAASQLATLSLVDHLDMARPAHEDPGRGAVVTSQHRSILVPSSMNSPSSLLAVRDSSAISVPITIAPSVNGSPGKYILISPPSHRGSPMSAPSPIAFPSSPVSSNLVSSSAQSSSTSNMIKSPTRRVREGKKCRKVYGLEQRDLWCTQCKWKKACARFGANGGVGGGGVLSTSFPTGTLLMPAVAAISPPHRSAGCAAIIKTSSNAARAIKF